MPKTTRLPSFHRGQSSQADHLGRRAPGPGCGLLAWQNPHQCHQHCLVKVRDPSHLASLGFIDCRKITDTCVVRGLGKRPHPAPALPECARCQAQIVAARICLSAIPCAHLSNTRWSLLKLPELTSGAEGTGRVCGLQPWVVAVCLLKRRQWHRGPRPLLPPCPKLTAGTDHLSPHHSVLEGQWVSWRWLCEAGISRATT